MIIRAHVERKRVVSLPFGKHLLLAEDISVLGKNQSIHNHVGIACLSVVTHDDLIPVLSRYSLPVPDLKELKELASRLSVDLRSVVLDHPEDFV